MVFYSGYATVNGLAYPLLEDARHGLANSDNLTIISSSTRYVYINGSPRDASITYNTSVTLFKVIDYRVSSLSLSAYKGQYYLSQIVLPNLEAVSTQALAYCSSLNFVKTGPVSFLGNYWLSGCGYSTSLVIDLTALSIVPQTYLNTFGNIGTMIQSIMVPSSLYKTLVKSDHWSSVSNALISV